MAADVGQLVAAGLALWALAGFGRGGGEPASPAGTVTSVAVSRNPWMMQQMAMRQPRRRQVLLGRRR